MNTVPHGKASSANTGPLAPPRLPRVLVTSLHARTNGGASCTHQNYSRTNCCASTRGPHSFTDRLPTCLSFRQSSLDLLSSYSWVGLLQEKLKWTEFLESFNSESRNLSLHRMLLISIIVCVLHFL